MIDTMQLSSRIYARLLVLYPGDLRRAYGTEMAFVFAEDIEAARREGGLRGVIRVWRCALAEFLRFALPGHASSPFIRVPAVWFAFSTATLTAEMLMSRCRWWNAPTFFHAVCAALLLPALTSPTVSLAAVWACRGQELTSLGLSDAPRTEHAPCSKSTI
ncbi:MAG TPA: hypothetical protein VMS37_11595 [Verrucomicrobiae bacterium]|nr:hypothetical protein [Verrucomicrobiae bacterium]